MNRRLLVTHHAPDLDAITAVWLFKRFDSQHYADASVAFVDPGATIYPSEAQRLGFQMNEVVHVDTGLGEFDHHQPDRGLLHICASSLVFDSLCKMHPELEQDAALQELVGFVTDIDHFGEVSWPDSNSTRNCFMIHELLHGFESVDPHTDESQLHFGFQCLDCAYASLKETLQAASLLAEGKEFQLPVGKCLAIETKNDTVIKFAQKDGYMVVVRKDPEGGEIRIKARPDANIDLKAADQKIRQLDPVGTWYYHPSGKMLLNGSRKHRHQTPTSLSIQDVINILQEVYA